MTFGLANAPVMPCPMAAGVLGIVRIMAASAVILFWMLLSVFPAAMERTKESLPMRWSILRIASSMICGLTARIMTFCVFKSLILLGGVSCTLMLSGQCFSGCLNGSRMSIFRAVLLWIRPLSMALPMLPQPRRMI